ncbi:hypothetical protein [Streptomyces sp. OR43]|uniref:hypothetical protein n=1 Tax=Streptomyces sp. or43 TaxID=2478957 RepID=UPI0011CE75B4|nr:hypothetical protein [Streptomyces sp. or43]
MSGQELRNLVHGLDVAERPVAGDFEALGAGRARAVSPHPHAVVGGLGLLGACALEAALPACVFGVPAVPIAGTLGVGAGDVGCADFLAQVPHLGLGPFGARVQLVELVAGEVVEGDAELGHRVGSSVAAGAGVHPDGTPYSYFEITAEGWGFCNGCRMWSTASPERPHACPETCIQGPVAEEAPDA